MRQLSTVRDQDQQPLMGSPRINQDELTGGLILAPGSESTASVSEPLADIAGGKSGTEAEIENPYDNMPTAGVSGGQGGSGADVQRQQPSGQDATTQGQADPPGAASGNASQEQVTQASTDGKGDDYSEQQQSQQASSGCKQS